MQALSLAREFQTHLTRLHVISHEKPGELVNAAELGGAAGKLSRKLVRPEAVIWCVPPFRAGHGPLPILSCESERAKGGTNSAQSAAP